MTWPVYDESMVVNALSITEVISSVTNCDKFSNSFSSLFSVTLSSTGTPSATSATSCAVTTRPDLLVAPKSCTPDDAVVVVVATAAVAVSG